MEEMKIIRERAKTMFISTESIVEAAMEEEEDDDDEELDMLTNMTTALITYMIRQRTGSGRSQTSRRASPRRRGRRRGRPS